MALVVGLLAGCAGASSDLVADTALVVVGRVAP